MKILIFALAMSALSRPLIAQDSRLPNPVAPFQALKGERQTPILKVGTFEWGGKLYGQPSFCVGSKHLGVRETYKRADYDEATCLLVDGVEVLRIMGNGFYEGLGFGFPFKTKDGTTPEFKIDEQAKTITYSKQYLLPGGETATYSHTLKPLTDSKVELSWNMGISQEKLDSLPKDFKSVGLWIVSPVEVTRNNIFQINKQQLQLNPLEKLTDQDTPLTEGTGLDFVYAPDQPMQSFSFNLPDRYSFVAAENKRGFIIRAETKQRQAQDKLVIDLGIAPDKDATAPPPVAGIDFWQNDALCVSAPTTRNLMPNPSFEQGLRYWNWWPNGGQFIPSTPPKYSISPDSKFGGKSVFIREGGGCPMLSFPIPIVKGKTYTASFYAKAQHPNSSVAVGVMSAVKGSQFDWMKALNTNHSLTTDWARYSYTFTADMAGACVAIHSYYAVWIDGIQVEEGAQPTDFVAPAIEGTLLTSDPDNALPRGAPIGATFALCGKPGLAGEVALTLFNFYREKVYSAKHAFTLDKDGGCRIELPLDGKRLGTGVFVMQADYRVGDGAAIRDYYRLSIMDFLENKHATKNIFGSMCEAHQITRGDDLAKMYMRWGFGSKTYGVATQGEADLYAKYGISDFLALASDMGTPEQKKMLDGPATQWSEVPPGGEKMIEDTVCDVVKAHPWQTSWAFSTETELKSQMLIKGKQDEWAKVLLAFQRGVKRANPNAIVLPDGGTSGFNRLRGFRETEGYFIATQGKVKWDAVATHPYSMIDDMDTVTDLLSGMMQKYGHGKETPIDYTEGYGVTATWLPEWGDDGFGDNYQAGKPSYDFGWKEYMQASQAARIYITCLKYWPQVRSFNIWVFRPYMDQYLTPLALCKIPNTLGHLLGKPKFQADLRPAAGVRGYVFEDEEGRGVAALWTNIPRVEQGTDRGPEMQVKFDGQTPEFIDLMGNVRDVHPQNGVVTIPLTPAPLFIRSAKGGAAKLTATLNQGHVAGAASSLKVSVQPSLGGDLQASIANLSTRPLSGTLSIGESKQPFETPAQGNVTCLLPEKADTAPGKITSWKKSLGVKIAAGRVEQFNWDMAFFYVPHAASPLPLDPAAPQWQNIPAIALTNWCVKKNTGVPPVKAGYPGDLDAKFQLAWDKDNLYLRISATDDHFILTAPEHWTYDPSRDSQLYMHDGCAEVYFDTGANGRSNLVKGFDADDYRYDFYAGDVMASNGPGSIYRQREPFQQLAGGIDMPNKTAAAKGVKCQFQRTPDGYAYVMIFPQKYIQPLKLEKGWLAGFGIYLHDNDDPHQQWPQKGLSLSTQPGIPCDNTPETWPIMILSE